MNRAAAAENDHCNEPGGAEAAPARRKEQPRSSSLDESRSAHLLAGWRTAAASETGSHDRDGGGLSRDEPRGGEAPTARQGSTPLTGRDLLAIHRAQVALNKRLKRVRREKSHVNRTSAKRGVTRRGKAGRRARRSTGNSSAHNKIITWQPAALEVAGEKMPKRPWDVPIASNGSMCAEQQIDHQAACDGKITWQSYFAKWGPRL